MTRTLTAAVTEQKNSNASRPYCLAKFELGASIGDIWVSDRALGAGDGGSWDAAQGRVLEWGRLHAALSEDGRYNPVGDTTLVLSDHDGLWHGYCQAAAFQGKVVTLYQHFAGLDKPHLTPIFKGIIAGTPQWNDERRRLTLRLTDYSTRYRKTIGVVSDREKFPFVAPGSENAVLPIIFGRVRRSECVPADVGPVARLTRRCAWDDTRLFVDDASAFPQNTPITIRIQGEIAEGSFSGNTFTATARYVPVASNRTVGAAVDETSFDDLGLSSVNGRYVGYHLYVPGEWGGLAPYRRIVAYDGTLRRIFFGPLPYYHDGSDTLPAGTPYSIESRGATLVLAHEPGAQVVIEQDGYVFVVADHPCKAVRAVEGYGRARNPADGGDQSIASDFEGYFRLDSDLYQVNLNDDRFASVLGHNVTTITFPRLPQELWPKLTSNRIWADVDGVESAGDSTGALIENPASVIYELLTNPRWGNVPAEEVNAGSFAAAGGALGPLKMGFSMTRQRDLLDMLSSLAWQARCALNWNDGRACLSLLSNGLSETEAQLDADRFELGSLRLEQSSLEDVASEIVCSFTDRGEEKKLVVRDAAVEAALGRRALEREFWAYSDRRCVLSAATFWLDRLKNVYEIARLRCWLKGLELERNDSVALNYPSLFVSGQGARVLQADYSPGGGEMRSPPSIELALRLPRSPGCSGACEAGCETAGCETGCEYACELSSESCWQCETACEDHCQVTGCTTSTEEYCASADTGCEESGPCGACETACTTACELDACETGCEVACESGCQTACEVTCETDCEVQCESGCESDCQTGCESDCQSGCETSCETGGCETACETGCETFCETGCESVCELTCESDCQSACESQCEMTCELNCETGDESCAISCEASCQATACETACELECETGGETCALSCQAGCQAGCETACQASCELACETGCEIACETGCETSCETGGCETSCETGGCETSCETGGCETSCETGCEVICESLCETACQTGCEVACETGCETACETGCETSDEGFTVSGAGDDTYNGHYSYAGTYDGVSYYKRDYDTTGGEISESGGYCIHKFTVNGSFVSSCDLSIEYLIVGGGGSGGHRLGAAQYRGGGGGAGGMITGSESLAAGSYPVTVGAGGAAQTGGTKGNDGGNSVFNGHTAHGGGGGGGSNVAAGNGGSGGGGGGTGNMTGGTGTAGEGSNGGNGSATGSTGSGGGGGGKSAAGANASGDAGGAGGDGATSSITGSEVTYAGGGGGSGSTSCGAGGAGGGGAGAYLGNGTPGTDGLGGGGGGSCQYGGGQSGKGGDGVVIIRYQLNRYLFRKYGGEWGLSGTLGGVTAYYADGGATPATGTYTARTEGLKPDATVTAN